VRHNDVGGDEPADVGIIIPRIIVVQPQLVIKALRREAVAGGGGLAGPTLFASWVVAQVGPHRAVGP
jgi:hypothetical protein